MNKTKQEISIAIPGKPKPIKMLVRLTDKLKRLKHFYRQKELAVKDEKIVDTTDDLINYALYLKIMYKQERNNDTD